MSREASEACRQIRDALVIEGKNPEWHRHMIHEIKSKWPVLWRALDRAHAVADQEDRS